MFLSKITTIGIAMTKVRRHLCTDCDKCYISAFPRKQAGVLKEKLLMAGTKDYIRSIQRNFSQTQAQHI
ncbi:MAG: hypothetical protein EA411_11015 [Saprospirales bacterium]|nr:MAG: hypothetical protein EA411_11015 [Saprospirales bacterium]